MKITPAAAEQLSKLLKPGEYLEVGLEGGGCGGATVTLSKVDSKSTDALSIGEITNVIYADSTTRLYLQGGAIDVDDSVFNARFLFKPPLGTESCGCGASIKIEPNGPKG